MLDEANDGGGCGVSRSESHTVAMLNEACVGGINNNIINRL